MIIKTDDSFLRVKIVSSIQIYTHKTKETINNGWFKRRTVEEHTTYTLEMKYTNEDDIKYTTSWDGSVKSDLEKLYKSLVEQIRDQDSQYADKLLEDAIIGGGTK